MFRLTFYADALEVDSIWHILWNSVQKRFSAAQSFDPIRLSAHLQWNRINLNCIAHSAHHTRPILIQRFLCSNFQCLSISIVPWCVEFSPFEINSSIVDASLSSCVRFSLWRRDVWEPLLLLLRPKNTRANKRECLAAGKDLNWNLSPNSTFSLQAQLCVEIHLEICNS